MRRCDARQAARSLASLAGPPLQDGLHDPSRRAATALPWRDSDRSVRPGRGAGSPSSPWRRSVFGMRSQELHRSGSLSGCPGSGASVQPPAAFHRLSRTVLLSAGSPTLPSRSAALLDAAGDRLRRRRRSPRRARPAGSGAAAGRVVARGHRARSTRWRVPASSSSSRRDRCRRSAPDRRRQSGAIRRGGGAAPAALAGAGAAGCRQGRLDALGR